MNYKTITLKSREEIENTMEHIEYAYDDTCIAKYKGNQISFSKYLWDVCDTTLTNVVDHKMRTHEFDYAYLHEVSADGSRPYIYIMEEWIKKDETENI